MNVQSLFREAQPFNRTDICEQLQNWFITRLSELLEVEQDEVEVDIPFDRYGLDSSAAVGLTGELSDLLEIDVEPTLLYDYPTVETLVDYLSKQLEQNHYEPN
jgi:acyl carrier protein